MTRVVIPRNKVDVIKALDLMIEEPVIDLGKPVFRRKLGRYIDVLRDNGDIGIYWDEKTHEAVGILKTKDVRKINGKGNNVEYLFNNLKVKLPSVEL